MKKKILRLTAHSLLLSFVYQLAFPVYAHALTTGPSQPEVQSFEPVGTTDMVNMFTGDFTYNIPLMDVEGYPINIAYHSGVNMEQEATWCGLGWNINPGEINRNVRGLPDDFNGESIERLINIKPEKNVRIGAGIDVALEFFGKEGKPKDGAAAPPPTGDDKKKKTGFGLDFSLGLYGNYNSYKGMSAGMTTGFGFHTPVGGGGISMGVGSQTGADVDVNVNLRYGATEMISKDMTGSVSVGVGIGTGFNTRQGLKDYSFNASASASAGYGSNDKRKDIKREQTRYGGGGSMSYSSTVLVAPQNYVPVLTNENLMKGLSFQVKAGGEFSMFYPNLYLNAQISTLKYSEDGTRRGFGYLYGENAKREDIMDFSREKDGVYNETMKNLPIGANTYDVYSVSGQGSGGSFRPFRNDVGAFHDPYVGSKGGRESKDFNVEVGYGNFLEIGSDINFFDNSTTTGAWKDIPFSPAVNDKLYEKVFFKAAGELTYNNQIDNNPLWGNQPLYVAKDGQQLVGKHSPNVGTLPKKIGADNDRTSRANLISYLTTAEASIKECATSQRTSYFADNASGNSRFFDPEEKGDDRLSLTDYNLRAHQIGVFTQTLPDGRRYTYDLPALNHMSREVSFSADESRANIGTGLIKYTPGADDSKNNQLGRDNYYNSTTTPAYAHSYLLTSVLATDYVDILGDGPTDDDLGAFTKFNYKKWSDDYRWRAPYPADSAQYNPGYWSDAKDGKASYVVGSREVWQLRSIESKNYVAEFYVSERLDGKGSNSAVLDANSNMRTPGNVNLKGLTTQANTSFKLDSIKLYNKHDRYINENKAVPVKTVIFKYDYSLCKGIPNTSDASKGKLTLREIYFRFGNSEKSLLSPYVFNYNTPNPGYDFAAKDRWGSYKPANPALTNYEFPYAAQAGAGVDSAAAWNLNNIKLPSGGRIQVAYECKDYAFVQDRRAMEMFIIQGFGTSPALQFKNQLYEENGFIDDYVYFKRDKQREKSTLDFRANYLEGQSKIYYSVNTDITGNGKFEHIKGYAEIKEVGICPNNSDYGYVRLTQQQQKGMWLNAITLNGINTARANLPHILYPGQDEESDFANIAKGLAAAFDELKTFYQNPFVRFIAAGKAKRTNPAKSWLRLQSPGMDKKGGGIRVRELKLTDNWNSLAGGNAENAEYGKQYDYTMADGRYGRISSGVASYEPLAGGDENPFRQPAAAYESAVLRGLPSLDFYQEEPFGESFFPGAQVGYAQVTVRSIHAAEGRSAQSEDEYGYYTARDFPVRVDYTDKETDDPVVNRTLTLTSRSEYALQGYTLRLNDMHGKPKHIANYIVSGTGTGKSRDPITGTKYNYQTGADGGLDNHVTALVRKRGVNNDFEIQNNVVLGEEMDVAIDSRNSYSRSYTQKLKINVNSTIYGPVVAIVPTAFHPANEEVQELGMLVTTKIIQQYGILQSTERFDHNARTVMTNLIYDAESGDLLLTSADNEFKDLNYEVKHPAYLAQVGMGPAYMNSGYEAQGASMYPDSSGVRIRVVNARAFAKGDELLLRYFHPQGEGVKELKVWVIDFLQGSSGLELLVAPRFKSQGNGIVWPDFTSTVYNVAVKVVRSGRRNMLTTPLQQATLMADPKIKTFADLVAIHGFENILSITGGLYFDRPDFYSGIADLNTDAGDVYKPILGDSITGFNPYAVGRRGVWRLEETYTGLAKRTYSSGHVRYDGGYKVVNSVWISNNRDVYQPGNDNNVLFRSSGRGSFPNSGLIFNSEFNRPMYITNIDQSGNVREELNVYANKSSAQYDYNGQKVAAVGSNVRHSEFFFDGFESYAMLIPENLRAFRFTTSYLFTPFAPLFRTQKLLNGGYSNSNSTPLTSPQHHIRRSGQNYVLLDSQARSSGTVIGNTSLTAEASHSGRYALKCTGTSEIPLRSHTAILPSSDMLATNGTDLFDKAVNAFTYPVGKKCIVNMWVKPFAGSNAQYNAAVKFGSATQALVPKSGSIDGWYLLEAICDFNGFGPAMALVLPANAYVDDVRIVPVTGSMKSFVYDPFTFRLAAQLDENHIATLYEYDQEGLLIRTKRETTQGIKTLTENRRANAKR